MNDSRGPEGNRMQMPGWEPAEDNAARPYLDQVADLQAKLAEKEAGRPAGVSDAEAERSRRAERDAFFKSLVIKLDGAARRSAPGVVEDIEGKFNALQDYLTEADRLQMQMGPGKQPIYKVLERAADGKSKLTMGELEAARGHFLSWHGQAGQTAQDVPPPPAAVPMGGFLGTLFGIFRSSSQATKDALAATAHLRAYFGKDFARHNKQQSLNGGWPTKIALGFFASLVALVFYQGIESQSDPYDDSLGFVGRIIYNVSKLPAAIPLSHDTPVIGRHIGGAYVEGVMKSTSTDTTTKMLKAHFASIESKVQNSQRELAAAQIASLREQAKMAPPPNIFERLNEGVTTPSNSSIKPVALSSLKVIFFQDLQSGVLNQKIYDQIEQTLYKQAQRKGTNLGASENRGKVFRGQEIEDLKIALIETYQQLTPFDKDTLSKVVTDNISTATARFGRDEIAVAIKMMVEYSDINDDEAKDLSTLLLTIKPKSELRNYDMSNDDIAKFEEGASAILRKNREIDREPRLVNQLIAEMTNQVIK